MAMSKPCRRALAFDAELYGNQCYEWAQENYSLIYKCHGMPTTFETLFPLWNELFRRGDCGVVEIGKQRGLGCLTCNIIFKCGTRRKWKEHQRTWEHGRMMGVRNYEAIKSTNEQVNARIASLETTVLAAVEAMKKKPQFDPEVASALLSAVKTNSTASSSTRSKSMMTTLTSKWRPPLEKTVANIELRSITPTPNGTSSQPVRKAASSPKQRDITRALRSFRAADSTMEAATDLPEQGAQTLEEQVSD